MQIDVPSRFGVSAVRTAPSRPARRPPPDNAPAAPPPASRPVPALLRRLLDADEPQGRGLVRGLLDGLGFRWLGFCRVSVRDRWPRALSYCTTWADTEWGRHYLDEDFVEVDPRMHEATRSGAPCVWHIDELEHLAPLDLPHHRVVRFVDALRRTGMRSGVLFALPGERLHERDMVGLLSPTPGSRWIGEDVLEQAWTLALAVHGHQLLGAVAADPPGDAGPPLSPVQQNILRCLADGLADKAIAASLGLSLHNVDYHMRQLRKRHGARNRLQLMQAAARLLRR